MKPTSQSYQEIPIQIAAGNTFGRYPKISISQTFNMITSDNWLVPSAGYKNVLTIDDNGQGRGIYSSAKLNKMFLVINNTVYSIDENLIETQIGTINTFAGDVFISENNVGQIIFSDLNKLYVYDNTTGSFTAVSITFTPGYITFQNGRFGFSC